MKMIVAGNVKDSEDVMSTIFLVLGQLVVEVRENLKTMGTKRC